jgi:hypothetical protein
VSWYDVVVSNIRVIATVFPRPGGDAKHQIKKTIRHAGLSLPHDGGPVRANPEGIFRPPGPLIF